MSDAELKRARGVLLSYQAPCHGGVSLTAKTALLGDPMWRSMVAPALAWAAAVWSTTAAPCTASFTLPQLRS
eukprot:2126790-Pyramimonas_sp.AAC.1